MPKFAFVLLAAAVIAFVFAAPSANAAPDACSLLTPAQIKSAISTDVGAGTAGSAKLCTWNVSSAASSNVKFITLLLQDTNAFAGGKGVPAPAVVTPVSGVGDDAYFVAVRDQVGLIVKKGSSAFKIAVYARVPLEQKQSMEQALAQQIVSQL